MNISAIAPEASVTVGDSSAFSSNPTAEAEAMKQFESVMLSMVLKQMRQTGSEEGMFPGDKSDTLGGMFDTYLGEHLAEAGGLGLMESLGGQLNSGNSGLSSADALQQLRSQAMEAYTSATSVIPE